MTPVIYLEDFPKELFRAFDWAYHLGYVSKIKYGWNYEQIEIDGKYFLSDEDINEWLEIYKDNVEAPDVTLEQLWLEYNLHMPYVALGMSYISLSHTI